MNNASKSEHNIIINFFFKKVFKKVLTFLFSSYIMKKIKKGVKQMKIYYLEFKNSVKFYNKEMDASIEIEKSKLLELFLKAIYKKYGKDVKFECLI